MSLRTSDQTIAIRLGRPNRELDDERQGRRRSEGGAAGAVAAAAGVGGATRSILTKPPIAVLFSHRPAAASAATRAVKPLDQSLSFVDVLRLTTGISKAAVVRYKKSVKRLIEPAIVTFLRRPA